MMTLRRRRPMASPQQVSNQVIDVPQTDVNVGFCHGLSPDDSRYNFCQPGGFNCHGS